MSEPDDATIIAQLERMGEAQVRLKIASGQFPTQLQGAAFRWLAGKESEALARSEVSQREQSRTARSAKNAAWIAAIAAIVAAIFAIIAWVSPHS